VSAPQLEHGTPVEDTESNTEPEDCIDRKELGLNQTQGIRHFGRGASRDLGYGWSFLGLILQFLGENKADD
jgi:hypothetical protein